MPITYDAVNLKVEGLNRLEDLYHYLKLDGMDPSLVLRFMPEPYSWIDEQIYDMTREHYLGQWMDGTFDFAGADDATVDRLDKLFRHFLPVIEDAPSWMDSN